MAKIFRRQYDVSLAKRKRDEDEFGPGKKGIIICPECGCAYFKKSWHHDFKGLPDVKEGKDIPVKFKLCPADQMIKNHQFEGEVRIKNIPQKYRADLEKLIAAFGKRAYNRDPMDRIINIKKSGANWIVTTTENQLANKLAKKISQTFKKSKVKTSFIQEPGDVARSVVEFGKK